MPDAIRRILTSDFMPHGACYFWEPWLVWLHVIADSVIALSYAAIPAALIYFAVRRRDVEVLNRWMFTRFGIFIVACGATHVMEVWNIWHSDYLLSGVVKALTALASLPTAWLLVRLIPKAVAAPSPAQLTDANHILQREIEARKLVEIELARRVEELAEANRKLIEAERFKTEFLSNVSHELRTPLTLILGPVEALLDDPGGGLNAQQARSLQVIHNNSVRLLKMISGLLDFSKLAEGAFQPQAEPIEIVSLTRSIWSDFSPLMDRKKLHGTFECEESEIWVLSDRYLYERIIFNLLSNAVKFTNEEGAVHARLVLAEQGIRISLQDSGIGMSPAEAAGIFERFRQGEGSSARRFEGIGLGLALVREFTELLHGTVALQTQLGRGSTFTINLPATPADNSGQLNNPASTLIRSSERFLELPVSAADFAPPAVAGASVLLAEDNVELATHITRLLHNSCQISVANDGEQALQLLHTGKLPELVIADIMMPKRDGLQLCRDIKANPNTAEIPVVLLTALTHRDALLEGWEAGADEYLFKPFHPQELITRIRSLLKAARGRKRSREQVERLSFQLLHVQDRERQRIAREVHDGIGQYVSGLSLALGRLRTCTDDPNPEFRQALADCSELIGAAGREIRSISYLLYPPMMNELGLKSALQWLVAGYQERSEIAVSFEAPADLGKLQPEVEIALFRIAQESLNNVHRHSDSDSAVVRLLQRADQVVLEVADHGKGMPSENFDPWTDAGVGIRGMRERVRELKGSFKLDSSPNNGVTVRVALPIA